jgi:hypothetical protein
MEQDLRKLGEWIERACREQVAIERLILEWKKAGKLPSSAPQRVGKG